MAIDFIEVFINGELAYYSPDALTDDQLAALDDLIMGLGYMRDAYKVYADECEL